jgi:hypothetical protein
MLCLHVNINITFDYHRTLKSKETLPDETVLVLMNVISLHTSFPHEEGITSCKEAWDSQIIKNLLTEILVRLLVPFLKYKNFTFNDKHFLQV